MIAPTTSDGSVAEYIYFPACSCSAWSSLCFFFLEYVDRSLWTFSVFLGSGILRFGLSGFLFTVEYNQKSTSSVKRAINPLEIAGGISYFSRS
jgi:hypothetical protein